MKQIFSALTVTLIMLFTATAANAQSDPDKIVYEFKDKSIQPQYQRNYIITVTSKEATIVVRSSEELNSKTVVLDEKKFNDLLNTIKKAKLARLAIKEGKQGCAGGTTDIISLFEDEQLSFEGSVYRCAGQDSGFLSGDYNAVIKKLKALFPGFEALIK